MSEKPTATLPPELSEAETCGHCGREWPVPTEQASAVKIRGRCISCNPNFASDEEEARIMIDRYGIEEGNWPPHMSDTLKALTTGYLALSTAHTDKD